MISTQVAIIIEDFAQLRAKCGYEGMAIGAKEILWCLDNGIGGGSGECACFFITCIIVWLSILMTTIEKGVALKVYLVPA